MAASKVLMPRMGYDMVEGKIIRWIKKEGDQVTKGEPIAEIETEKVNIEIEAFASGTLLKIIVPEGESVPVGQQIAVIGEPGDAVEEAEEAPGEKLPEQMEGTGEGGESQPTGVAVTSAGGGTPTDVREKAAEEARAAEPKPRETQEPGTDRFKVSPVARKYAQEQGVELGEVQGTGPGGRITKEDVERFLGQAAEKRKAPAKEEPREAAEEAAPAMEAPPGAPEKPVAPTAAPPEGEQPAPAAPSAPPVARPAVAASQPVEGVPSETRELSRMGQAIARRMAESKQTVPHFYATVEIDMSAAANLRGELNRTLPEERKISFNDFILKAASLALTRFPTLNASFAGDKMVLYQEINMAQAVAMEQGLITPVIRNCDQKPLAQVARESKELVSRVKEGKLRQEDYQGGTFTVSNMGMFGVEQFAAIINPPQAAILALGAIAPRPVVRDGNLTVSQTMKATLSVDHRVANGADGARYLQEFQRLLEDPVRLLL